MLLKTAKIFLLLPDFFWSIKFLKIFSVALLPFIMSELHLIGEPGLSAAFKGFLESGPEVTPSQVGVVSGHAANEEP